MPTTKHKRLRLFEDERREEMSKEGTELNNNNIKLCKRTLGIQHKQHNI